MKRTSMLLLVLVLAACGKAAPMDTVDSLVAHPDRLKEVQRLCQEDHAKVGDATCSAASEAFRRRFMGDGKGKYTPQPAPRN
ncbi:EexN family lipoprotein [Metallibacterium sp.]|uniref:EexN family lipoprotein n=1 Tax=Metallibacterium sp. TaxID=2940281 RepID=UPI0026121AE0|nr:EexN family lipoprotein [Metallibacterium sp.]